MLRRFSEQSHLFVCPIWFACAGLHPFDAALLKHCACFLPPSSLSMSSMEQKSQVSDAVSRQHCTRTRAGPSDALRAAKQPHPTTQREQRKTGHRNDGREHSGTQRQWVTQLAACSPSLPARSIGSFPARSCCCSRRTVAPVATARRCRKRAAPMWVSRTNSWRRFERRSTCSTRIDREASTSENSKQPVRTTQAQVESSRSSSSREQSQDAHRKQRAAGSLDVGCSLALARAL